MTVTEAKAILRHKDITMTAQEAQAVLAMQVQALLPMELVSAGLYENAVTAQQASNANAQAAAAANASLTTANQTIATALAALNASLKPAAPYTDLSTATAAVAPALASEAQQVTTANQQVTALQGQLDAANSQITALQATVAGTAGSYQLSLTKAQEIAVEKEATKQGTTPAAIVALLAIPPFTALAGTHTPDILATGLANYEAMTAAQQNAILTAFGPPLNALVNMPLAQQLPFLATMVPAAFVAQPAAAQNAILKMLGM
jgi:hypothetical protein